MFVFTKGRQVACLLGKKVCTEHLKNGWKFHGKMSPQESIAFCKGYKAALGCGKKVHLSKKKKLEVTA